MSEQRSNAEIAGITEEMVNQAVHGLFHLALHDNRTNYRSEPDVKKIQALIEAARASAIPSDRVAKLEEALRWFLEDPRFQVSVGGNPNVVDKMLADARAALSTQGETK